MAAKTSPVFKPSEIEITPVNDSPSFTPGEDIVVDEDAGDVMIPGWAADIQAGQTNEFDQILAFSLQAITGADLFLALPALDPVSGDLSFTPADNAFGTAEFTILLQDDGGTENEGVDRCAEQTLTITVNPVNDAPVVTAQNFKPG